MALVVSTENGLIEGSRKKGFQSFLGIPYARLPIGELRFRGPEPIDDPETRATMVFGKDTVQESATFEAERTAWEEANGRIR